MIGWTRTATVILGCVAASLLVWCFLAECQRIDSAGANEADLRMMKVKWGMTEEEVLTIMEREPEQPVTRNLDTAYDICWAFPECEALIVVRFSPYHRVFEVTYVPVPRPSQSRSEILSSRFSLLAVLTMFMGGPTRFVGRRR
jgi:hypothetical protein